MVEQISGIISEKTPTFCIINCGGIGLGINISLNTFAKLKNLEPGSEIFLHSHLYVREDALQLYGFSDKSEKNLFRMLISVTGIGPRLALTLLSGPSTEEIQHAISSEDIALLTRVPGVGRKTAQRLILELKEKMSIQEGFQESGKKDFFTGMYTSEANESLLALVKLGFKQNDAKVAIERAIKQFSNGASVEEILKLALKEM
jgi:Holliday junction DNA helicase RuvA